MEAMIDVATVLLFGAPATAESASDTRIETDTRMETAILAVASTAGPFVAIVGFPCGSNDYEQWMRGLQTCFFVLGGSAPLLKGFPRCVCIWMNTAAHTAYLVLVSRNWCFGSQAWWTIVLLHMGLTHVFLSNVTPGYPTMSLLLHVVKLVGLAVATDSTTTGMPDLHLQHISPDEWTMAVIVYMVCVFTGFVALIQMRHQEWPTGSVQRLKGCLQYPHLWFTGSSVAAADDTSIEEGRPHTRQDAREASAVSLDMPSADAATGSAPAGEFSAIVPAQHPCQTDHSGHTDVCINLGLSDLALAEHTCPKDPGGAEDAVNIHGPWISFTLNSDGLTCHGPCRAISDSSCQTPTTVSDREVSGHGSESSIGGESSEPSGEGLEPVESAGEAARATAGATAQSGLGANGIVGKEKTGCRDGAGEAEHVVARPEECRGCSALLTPITREDA